MTRVSERPGSVTNDQLDALRGLIIDLKLYGASRGRVIREAVPGYGYGDAMGALSRLQAGDLILYLEKMRRTG